MRQNKNQFQKEISNKGGVGRCGGGEMGTTQSKNIPPPPPQVIGDVHLSV